MLAQTAFTLLVLVGTLGLSAYLARLRRDELAGARGPAEAIGTLSLLAASALLLADAVPLWLQATTLLVLLVLSLRMAFALLYTLLVVPLIVLLMLSPAALALAAAAPLIIGAMAAGVLIAAGTALPKKSKL